MNDQELLTYAAKAIDLKWISYHHSKGLCCRDDKYGGLIEYYWNPLLNDADAFQLMCKLKIDLLFGNGDVEASYSTHKGFFHEVFLEFYADEQSKMSSARKVIVLAAAEIGKGM